MKLNNLLSILVDGGENVNLSSLPNIEIKKITSDSREAGPGVLFIAITGTQKNGHAFIAEVKKNGCSYIIGEISAKASGLEPKKYLQVRDSRLALGLLASAIEGNPSREMIILGVTGTSGKTTTSYLLESILHASGKKVGLIGTVSYRYDGKETPSTHTTPSPIELHRLLRSMRNQGCEAVVMEVSSHALKQRRTAGVSFDGALFTNLSAEHLDYHPDMEDYFRSKKMLFSEQAALSNKWGKKTVLAIHGDCSHGKRLTTELTSNTLNVFTVEEDVKVSAHGIRGTFSGIEIESNLIGRFNAENIAGAVALTRSLPKSFKISEQAIQNGIKNLSRIPGRLEQVPDTKGGRVILVDYAHKPDALEKVLNILRPMRPKNGKLICVVGCGGDRDRTKRPVMGEIACRLSDQVFFTSDNPRTEDPESILDEIVSGCSSSKNWLRITDRALAILTGVRATRPGDILLIAGKGHEDYQIIGTQKVHFDDREEALKSALSV